LVILLFVAGLISKLGRDLIYQKNNNNWKSFVVVLLVSWFGVDFVKEEDPRDSCSSSAVKQFCRQKNE